MGRDGTGWDGMGWDGMGWDGTGWDGMRWDRTGKGWDQEKRSRERGERWGEEARGWGGTSQGKERVRMEMVGESRRRHQKDEYVLRERGNQADRPRKARVRNPLHRSVRD